VTEVPAKVPATATTREAAARRPAQQQTVSPGEQGRLPLLPTQPPGQPGIKIASLRTDIARQQDVAYVSPPADSLGRAAAVLTVIPRTSPQDARTSALVQRLRDTVVPRATARTGVRALIGGQTAASIDTAKLISSVRGGTRS
jgi:putative drug exporter of the RND superfamily